MQCTLFGEGSWTLHGSWQKFYLQRFNYTLIIFFKSKFCQLYTIKCPRSIAKHRTQNTQGGKWIQFIYLWKTMFIFLSTFDLHWTIQGWHLIKEIQVIRCFAWMAGHKTIFVALIRNNYVFDHFFQG